MGAWFVLAAGGVATVARAADFDGGSPPPSCFEPNANGDLPTCTSNDGVRWVASYDRGRSTHDVAALGVLAVLLALAGAIVVIIMMRRTARDAGLDPDTATAVALVNNSALSAAWAVRAVRAPGSSPAQPPAPSVSQRLGVLEDLRTKGMVDEQEYRTRREAILGSL